MIEGIGSEIFFGLIFGIVTFVLMFRILRRVLGDLNEEELIHDEVSLSENVRPPVYNPNYCPICLGIQFLALETNCGHLYCGPCLQSHYMITGSGSSTGIVCSLCRQRVVLIFNCFSIEERQGILDPQALQTRDEVLQFVRLYNRIVRNDLSLMERFRELPVLLRHFFDDTIHGGRLGYNSFRWRLLSFIGITIAYIVLPFDIFPEIIYGIYGYSEDVLLFLIMSIYILIVYRNFIADE